MITWMLYSTVVAGLLSGAALAAERLCLSSGRSTRWCWAVAMAGSVMVPLLLPLLAGGAGQASAGSGGVGAVIGEAQVLAMVPEASAGASGPDRVVAAAWAATTALLLLVFARSVLALRRERRGWRAGVVSGSPVLVSQRTGPALVGFVWPQVVVPSWVLDWDERAVRLLVEHEREHEAAGDPLLLLGGMATLALLPWNLPLWWQMRRLRLAVEVDCDARVLRTHPDPRAYGDLLLRVGGLAATTRLAAAFAERSTFLERRMRVLAARPALAAGRAVALGALAIAALAAACAIPAPDAPDVGSLMGPAADAPPARTADDTVPTVARQPTFTPYEVRPELRNRAEVADILERHYPALLRDAGVGGTVTLWMFIDEGGVVQNTRLAKSSGHEALDAAADAAAREFRFTPALNRERQVPVWIQLPIVWGVDPEPAAATAPESRKGGEATAAATAPESRKADEAPAPASATPEPEARTDLRPAAAPAEAGPTFTPYEVRPELRNRAEFARELEASIPAILKDAGIGGTATLWVNIDERGRVADTRITKSSGFEELDEAAMRVMRTARFTPAQNRGEPVPVWIQLPVTFVVRD